jgi:hypothetical protein
MNMRIRWIALTSLAAGCSFIDDFEKFGPRGDTSVEHPSQVPDAAHDGPRDSDGGGTGTDLDAASPSEAGLDGQVRGDRDAHTEEGERDGSAATDAGSSDGASASDASVEPACPSTCDDGDPCTRNGCALDGRCTFAALDADGDTYATAPQCAPSSALQGGDCDDANGAIHPEAPEVCDGLDNNCAGGVDEGFARVACYPDLDRDGYPNLEAAPTERCTCAANELAIAGTIDDATRAAQHDCWDADEPKASQVHPGQEQHFTEPYYKTATALSFDYDCKGGAEKKFTTVVPASGCSGLLDLLICESTEGFSGLSPECGETGTYIDCTEAVIGICNGTSESRRQACH